MTAYYNEFDPYAAAWLRNLISAGHIAPGDVDERSIADVRPDELSRYTQCHFFAGIGVWSYALRRAGWADDRPVWTGSCPCQPFSAAGKGGGFDDERHLWPHFHWLISQCRPGVVLGEQVASKDGLAWLDLVQADLEGTGYAAGAVDLCAAGVGAPHIRQRLWWVGERLDDTTGARHVGALDRAEGAARDEARLRLSGAGCAAGRLDDDDDDPRLEGQRGGHRATLGYGRGSVRPTSEAGQFSRVENTLHTERRPQHVHRQDGRDGADGGREEAHSFAGTRSKICGLEHGQSDGRIERRSQPGGRRASGGCGDGGLADADGRDASAEGLQRGGEQRQQPEDGRVLHDGRPGPTNGLWRDADWLFCRDGKWRPVEPGTFPLAHGAPARVGRLRGYGNAINAQAAEAFIEAVDHAIADRHLCLTLSEMTTDNEGIFA